jgi:hypothetical protein
MSLQRFEIEKVYFVASRRNHKTGEITHEIVDNLSRLPRGWRPVFGTGSTSLEIVEKRLSQCDKGIWFKNEHKRRRKREAEDSRHRKRLHERYLDRRSKAGFDWSKYEKMLKA